MCNFTLDFIYMNSTQFNYFQHFKGGFYRVLFTAMDSETLETLIVYQAMYGENDIWVRPEKNFFSFVEINGKKVPRFRKLSREESKCLQQKIEVT